MAILLLYAAWKNDADKAAVAARKNGVQFQVCLVRLNLAKRAAETSERKVPAKELENAYMFYLDSVRSLIRTELEAEQKDEPVRLHISPARLARGGNKWMLMQKLL